MKCQFILRITGLRLRLRLRGKERKKAKKLGKVEAD